MLAVPPLNAKWVIAMARTDEWKNGCSRRVPTSVMLAAVLVLAMGFGLTVAPPASAAEINDLPGTYQLPLRAAAASSRAVAAAAPSSSDAPATNEAAPSSDAGKAASDDAAAKPSAGSATAAAGKTASDAAASAADPQAGSSAGTADGASGETASQSSGPAVKDGSSSAETKGDTAAATKDDAAATKSDAAAATKDDASATSDKKRQTVHAPTPASFTIAGMKYLQGRPLVAGEFSFRLGVAGVASIPLGSDLPQKLRQGSALTAAEKYELVAHSGLTYYPSATQPVPSDNTVENAADGSVTFEPLTFGAISVGEAATQRHRGVVFCYTIAELPPHNADGTLKDGVSRDALGRYVYRGVTYDDSVKRVYLYVYETGEDASNPQIAVVPLGDASFDGAPLKSAAGSGVGFVNTFNGAVLDSFLGAVSLDGEAIASGEFHFEVREVGEDGKLIDDQEVSCEASKGASHVAPVRLISDATFDEAGRFFYSVSQTDSARSVASKVKLDETSYVITVEVSKGDDDALNAAVTYVRKKPAGSDRWVDVALDVKPSPVTWDNTVKAPDDPGSAGDTPDAPDAGDGTDTGDPGAKPDGSGDGADAGAGTDTGAADGSAGSTTPGNPDDATATPDAGADRPEADGTAGTTDASPEADGAVKPDGQQGGAASAKPTDKDTASSAGNDAAKTDVSGDSKASDASKAPGAFAQTGDDLGLPMLIAFLVVIASGVALAVASRRRNPRD